MFLYNPVIFIFFIALIFAVFKKQRNSVLILFLIILTLYIISSWECFFYGCGYGCRPFIEYLTLLALPFAQFIQNSRRIVKATTILICTYLIYFNLSLIYNVFFGSGCFLGSLWDKPEYVIGKNNKVRLWNWREYRIYLERAKIFPFKSHNFVWKNNFEPDFSDYFDNINSNSIRQIDAPSGKFVTTTINEYSDGFFNVRADRISNYGVKNIKVSAYIKQTEVDSSGLLVCQINLDDSTYYWAGKKIIELTKKQNEWDTIYASFELSFIDYGALYNVYFWSPNKKNILIDDLKLDFRY